MTETTVSGGKCHRCVGHVTLRRSGVTCAAALMMYSLYIMRRTQIYLDEQQTAELERRARVSGRTRSAVIREAIGEYLTATPSAEQRLAEDAAFGIAPYLPPGHEYVEQMRSIRSERDEEIRRKWIDRDGEEA